jgi:hypothetical protein
MRAAFSFYCLVVACEPYATTRRARIARELACTDDRTRVVVVAREPTDPKRTTRWDAYGCGRAATFLCARDDGECWRAGEVRDAPAGPPLGAATAAVD